MLPFLVSAFPVIDVRGDIVAFGGRVLDKSEPKYLNTQETVVYSKRRNLYGINLAKKTKRPNAFPAAPSGRERLA